MPQPPTTERRTAGEKRLADLIDSLAVSKSSNSGETATRARVDLIWDVDPDRP